MTFICVLQPDAGYAEVEIEGNAHLIRTDIGYDDGSDLIFSLFVSLDLMPGHLWQLTFCIVEYDGATGATRDLYSGLDTVSFLIAGDRRMVLRHICGAAVALVNSVHPDRIEMIPVDRNLPEKAASKYRQIGGVIQKLGYHVNELDPYNGQHLWVFTRRATP